MTRRLRDRGPRRRCASDRTLVRTRPGVNIPPPPVPLNGQIYRMMTATAVADYEGLATASWSSGASGNINSLANSSWQGLYFHRVQTSPSAGYEVILPPVRWSVAVPASDGGTFDFWNSLSPNAGYTPQPVALIGSYGTIGLSDRLLPFNHFAEFANGFCQLKNFEMPWALGMTWKEAAFQAIAATTAATSNYLVSVAAIRHRVNGSAVGTLKLNPGSPFYTTDWRFDISKGDTYEIDVWVRFKIPPQASPSGNPVKAGIWVPQYRLFNNSKRVTNSMASVEGFNPFATFSNINFSPSLNSQEQTYQVTIAGHTGWTLKDGSNGPHKMVTGGGWVGGIGGGAVLWRFVPGNGKCNAIAFRYGRELPHVEFFPGPTHSGWEGAAANTSPLIYRPSHLSGYRSSTNSTDFGLLGHIDAGTINQAGTTVFNLQQGITNAQPDWFLFSAAYFPEAFEFGASTGVLDADVPTSITLTRVNQ